MMRYIVTWLVLCIASSVSAQEPVTHRFDEVGNISPAGWPDIPPTLHALAEKPLHLQFDGVPADWQPDIQIFRVTATRRIPLVGGESKTTDEGWRWIWTPPAARGPAHYEIHFGGTPVRVVRVETCDLQWFKETMEMLRKDIDWDARGLSHEELKALEGVGLQLKKASGGGVGEIASLTMIPRQGAAARRRVVWDDRDPNLIVWRPGLTANDLEVRAPRWWISPAALATDQGMIRLLDLFSEPPNQP